MAPPKLPKSWPPKEDEVLPFLGKQEREMFENLDPEVRTFLITASDQERQVFLALPPTEMFRFPKLTPEERAEYLRLTPSEKSLLAQLGDEDWRKFIKSTPEQRRALAASTGVGKEQQQKSQDKQKRSGELTRELEAAFSPWTSVLKAKAAMGAAIYNTVSGGGTDTAARQAGIKALVADIAVEDQLAEEVYERIQDLEENRWRAFLGVAAQRALDAPDRAAFVEAVVALYLDGKFLNEQLGRDKVDPEKNVKKFFKARGPISG